MKTITTTAIVALMSSTIGLSTMAPAIAQEAGPAQGAYHHRFGSHGAGPIGMGGDFLNFGGGGEAIEVALVRLSHRIDLTVEQKPLFDAFKTAALAAAEQFAAATDALRPTGPREGETVTVPDLTKRLENRIAFQTAQLAALQSIQPAATAFFDSLSDEQKAALTPQRPGRDSLGGKFGGPHHHRQLPGNSDAPAVTG